MDGQDHHPLMVVEQSPDVHFLGALATKNSLQRRLRIIGIIVAVPKLDGRNLELPHRSSKIVNTIEYWVVGGQFGPGAPRHDLVNLRGKALPFLRTPEVV